RPACSASSGSRCPWLRLCSNGRTALARSWDGRLTRAYDAGQIGAALFGHGVASVAAAAVKPKAIRSVFMTSLILARRLEGSVKETTWARQRFPHGASGTNKPMSAARKRANVSTISGKRRVRSRAEKENPAQARGKSQVRRMSGQLGDWGNLKAVQPALLT